MMGNENELTKEDFERLMSRISSLKDAETTIRVVRQGLEAEARLKLSNSIWAV